jgi:uncharacterized protein
MVLTDFIPNPFALLEDLRQQSPLARSPVHGERHWLWVACIGAYLLQEEREGDPVVVLLFALLHDSQREHEWHDRGHAAQGAACIPHYTNTYIRLTSTQLLTLHTACATHTNGRHPADSTIGLCWDVDRLNLWRISRQPRPHLLTTISAKRSDTIAWARRLLQQPVTWEAVFAQYDALLASWPIKQR